jgi:hypothetical protein
MKFKDDKRPQRYTWAPGGYLCSCVKCRENFAGDKRANLCADCAYSLPWPPPKPVDLIDRLKDLLRQAAEENSHHYTASLIGEAIVEIERLRRREFERRA